MRRWALVLAALVLAAPGSRAAQPADPFAVDYTHEITRLQQKLKNARNAEDRSRIADDLERTLHQMGPFDADGNRVHPKAMWHDTAIEALSAEVKRLESRPPTNPNLALAHEARLQTRRMASACLLAGWGFLAEDALKYQVDAFGQYLANNLKVLDSLFDELGQWCAKKRRLEADSPARAVYETSLDRAQEGVTKMREAADQVAALTGPDGEALAAAFGLYVEGLRAVRDADLALAQAEAAAPPPPSEEAASPASAAPAPGEPPPMTEEEKQRIAQVRQSAAALEGEAWQEIRQRLQRYADAIANGFAVASARPKAREFLDHIEQAAALALSLHEGKGVYPGYLEERLNGLKGALGRMESPLARADGYATLRWLWDTDRNRRVIAGGPVTPKAAEGIAYAIYVVQDEWRHKANRKTIERGLLLNRETRKIVSLLESLSNWPPKNLRRELKELYTRQLPVFSRALEDAGLAFATGDTDVGRIVNAADAGRDLQRLVRAQHVHDLSAQYLPARAGAMYEQLVVAAANLVLRQEPLGRARGQLDRLLQPFERLEQFKMPETRHQRAVTQIAGSAYSGARAFLNHEIAEGIQAASDGNPRSLQSALVADGMFSLLWRRSVVLTHRLDRFGLGNLAPLSLPESVWTRFITKMDQTLRSTLAAYPKLRQQNDNRSLEALAMGDNLYRIAAAAQRLTADARSPGEPDVDFLLRNLEATAVPEPRFNTWQHWASGYHATEAAGALLAGYNSTAEWHRSMLSRYQWPLTNVNLEPNEESQP